MAEEEAKAGKKKSPLVMTIVGVALLTLVGGGGGWFVGGMLVPKIPAPPAAAAPAPALTSGNAEGGKEETGLPRVATEGNGIVLLEPITTNLAYPTENWIRLEVALMFNGPVDAALAEKIHQDILAYIRTVSLQQLQGPRGFQYLKDDVQERVDLRSQGRVSKVLFRTFVVE